jgi:hypothetical protein
LPPWLTEELSANHRSILLGKAQEATIKLERVASWTDDNKAMLKVARKLDKACKVLNWYRSHGWTEQPATRNEDGKWPYLWPEIGE